MLRTSESFSMLSLPDLSYPKETNTEVIVLNCWQNVCLSKIWIPSHLLSNRKKPINSFETKGIFHTLQKRGHAKQIESFSVYDDDNSESEADIFLSDSDNDDNDETIGLDSSSYDRINTKESYEKSKNFPKLKSFPSCKNLNVESNISLNEILNSSAEVDITKFEFKNDLNYSHKQIKQLQSNKNDKTKKNLQESAEKTDDVSFQRFSLCEKKQNVESDAFHDNLNSTAEVSINNFKYKKEPKHSNNQVETVQSNKKKKNDKKKNKVVKSVTLDKFLEDYAEEDKQEDYANDYLRKVLMSKHNDGQVQLRNTYDFPDLTPEELVFIHSEKPVSKEPEMSVESLTEISTEPDATKTDECIHNHTEIVTALSGENTVGKIVIENIPLEACRDDIFTLLCGYGEVLKFSLAPDGHFLKAFVEIDLIGDIDWITECLNGTDPFGASSRVLKCYKQ